VFPSIGGGSPHPYYHALLKDNKRASFISNLVSVVLKYNLDRFDVDLEGSDIDENYERFVTELATALRAQNKMITAAVAVYYKDALSDKAFAQYDFVNVMSYDRTGPWSPENPAHMPPMHMPWKTWSILACNGRYQRKNWCLVCRSMGMDTALNLRHLQ
jgi:chitinase